MGSARVRVALRVFGESLEPEEVSALLACQPTESHRMGDRLPGPNGPHEAETGAWQLESELGGDPELPEVESAIESILSRLTADPDEWANLTTRFSAALHCALSPELLDEGFEISPRLARALAKRGLVIAFTLDGRG